MLYEVITARRQEVRSERRDRDHEPLEPHADVDEHADDHHRPQVRPDLLEPEELRDDHVARDHDPVGPGVVPERAVHEGEPLGGVV